MQISRIRLSDKISRLRPRLVASAQTCKTKVPVKVTKIALWTLKKIYLPGYAYQKAGVALLNLNDAGTVQMSLFSKSKDTTRLMRVMDQVNEVWGRGTLHSAAEGVEKE